VLSSWSKKEQHKSITKARDVTMKDGNRFMRFGPGRRIVGLIDGSMLVRRL
jgi:hypothetical protein